MVRSKAVSQNVFSEALLRMPERDFKIPFDQISERLGQDCDQFVAGTILNM
jgi:hypothetical protein